jgi:hypothetical protein
MGHEHNPNIDRDPAHLLSLALIPPHIVRRMDPKFKPGKMSLSQIDAVKSTLRMRKDQPFNRCKGKSKKRVAEFEAKGDFSHSKKNHICDLCQCRRKAGQGTKGDFYGLGPETGHVGVYFCAFCQLAPGFIHGPGITLKNARHEVEMMQRYGTVNTDSEYALKVMKGEAELAVREERVREDMQIVVDELARFKKLLEETDEESKPTESSRGGPVPMSDKTRISLMLDIASTISKLGYTNFKMDTDKYLHKTELTKRMPEMMTLAFQCFGKLEELIVAKQIKGEDIETERPPLEYVRDMFEAGMHSIWSTVRTGRKD